MKTATAMAAAPNSSKMALISFLAWSFIVSLVVLAIAEFKPPISLPATAPADSFSAERALKHVSAISEVAHPLGSSANATIRDYLVALTCDIAMADRDIRDEVLVAGARMMRRFDAMVNFRDGLKRNLKMTKQAIDKIVARTEVT